MVTGFRDDNLGAPASNAGDRFHELWALRKALSLLIPESPFQAMNVEGVPLKDSKPEEGSWDAVDVCLLAGGESLTTATYAVFSQLKYSTTSPRLNWTISRLTKTDAATKNNSPIRKLAEAFIAAEGARKDNPPLRYKLQFVSNQPVSREVLQALGMEVPKSITSSLTKKKRKLIKASGLSDAEFGRFSQELDFSECGSVDIFEQEERSTLALQKLIQGNPRLFHLELQRYIRDEMMPGRSSSPITEITILAKLGIANEDALFPCPSSIRSPDKAVRSQAALNAVRKLTNGVQYLAIHGGAGCGKTTTLSMLARDLPSGSVYIVFDCYGGGSYLDASQPRHRPQDAFTQISNELATLARVPRLLLITERGDPVKAFRERLESAASILKSSQPDALILIAIDAADNAVSAAERNHESCFIHEFVSLQNIPDNVRFVVSSRTSRRTGLRLPPTYHHEEINPFSLSETTEFVNLQGVSLSEAWIKDFHKLTLGIPRVQTYSFGLDGGPSATMNFLLPEGKKLHQIFEETVRNAWVKGGGNADAISLLCSALIALPRPVPIRELSFAIDLREDSVNDLCSDLMPTLLLKDGVVSFADEDFEDYVFTRGEETLAVVRTRIAQQLRKNSNDDAYSARHVVSESPPIA